MPEKLTKEIVNERIKDRNIVLIDNYINSKTKSTFKCQHNHEWKAKPTNILYGQGCPICSVINITFTKEIVNERIKHRNIVLIGDYINIRTKSTFRCHYNHEWKSTPNNVLYGYGCPICSVNNLKLTKEIVNERIKDRNIVLIDDYINNKTSLTFKCHHNHEWTSVTI